MDDQKHLLFINHFLPSNEQQLIDKFREVSTRRNTRGHDATRALANVSLDSIADIAVGPRHIAFLFKDGRVGRLGFSLSTFTAPPPVPVPQPPAPRTTAPAPPVTSASSVPSSSHPAVVARTAKFRRVMLATSSRRPDRAGVIVDRTRPLLPASQVPEDLIAQAQVVLQGKSREVIVRELQRTNLNVNEAVNNLLSRDDDEEEGSDGASEVHLPEELLSLLDASHGSLLESEALYGGDSFEYLMGSREAARRRGEKNANDKDAKNSRAVTSSRTGAVPETNEKAETTKKFDANGEIVFWEAEAKVVRATQPMRFIKIAATNSELLALSDQGKLYGWEWSSEEHGPTTQHPMIERLGDGGEDPIVDLAACSQRIAVVTLANNMATWIDHIASGNRLSQALQIPFAHLPLGMDEKPLQLAVSNQFAALRTSHNNFWWCGLFPLAERRRIFEKARTRLRKHVTFNTTEIVEGCEVRTKSGPIYAVGCIAANLNGTTPVVGVLMENAWSLSEVCRFRILDPSAYDADIPDDKQNTEREETAEEAVARQALETGNRKRQAATEVFAPSPQPCREEPWPIADVIFIHEEPQCDCAIVKIVDGAYCAVEYEKLPYGGDTDYFATSFSIQLARSTNHNSNQQKVRLIRKDELTVLTPKMRSVRSPVCMKTEPGRFSIPMGRRILSAVADSTGVRVLVDRRGQAHVMRLSIQGRTLSSHSLPVHAPSLHGPFGGPQLVNYGDDAILLLRDGFGGVIPLLRDSLMGFRDPTFLHIPATPVLGVGVAPIVEKERPSTHPKASRQCMVIALVGPDSSAIQRKLPSLLQAVMYTDVHAVSVILDKLAEEQDMELSRRVIVDACADGARNLLHVAVMNSFSLTNRNEADVEQPLNNLTSEDTRMAAEHVRELDQRWQRMLRSNSRAVATETTEAPQEANAGTQTDSPAGVLEQHVANIKREVDDESRFIVYPKPEESPKTRQANSIDIVKLMVTHSACQPFLSTLLSAKDVTGQTPFMCAVNVRAYSAARAILSAIENLCIDKQHPEKSESMLPYVFPSGSRPDDSPLFVLCYNDTCSFTWTGEEHINQDIFECRTCGLVGSLCCCTECAYTCHRNHDCKLKRTSPTAYCDCWEKCSCKALVAGNQQQREALLRELLSKCRLYEQTNSKGEHVALFLARTIGRQSNEQSNYHRRARRIDRGGGTNRETSTIPEHDLDPPKFAQLALLHCLRDWNVVRSIAMVGVRSIHEEQPVIEDIFHLNEQNGSTHIDKFVFTLISKCYDQMPQLVDELMNMLTKAANDAMHRRDGQADDVHFVISRFVRSVARFFLTAVILSPVAAAAAVTGTVPACANMPERSYRAISFSGFFSIVKKDLGIKDSKQKLMASFIIRCRVFFEHFSFYSIHELVHLANGLVAPLRLGVLRPSLCLAHAYGQNADNLDVIEKFLNSEEDLTSTMSKIDECQYKIRRKRRNSRRDGGDREDEADKQDSSADSDNASDSDSEHEAPVSSRRLLSHSSAANEDDGYERLPPHRPLANVIRSTDSDGGHSMDLSSDGEEEEETSQDREDEEEDDEDDQDDIDDDDQDRDGYGESEGDTTMNATYVVGEGDEGAEPEGSEPYSPPSPNYGISDDDGNTDENREGDGRPKTNAESAVNDGEEVAVEVHESSVHEPESVGDVVNQDEESTRDAVHSGSSSSSVPEPPASASNNQSEDAQSREDQRAERRLRRRVSQSSAAFDRLYQRRNASVTNTAPVLSWTVRPRPSTSWRVTAETADAPPANTRNTGTANNNTVSITPTVHTDGAPTSDAKAGGGEQSSSRPKEEEVPTVHKTAMQVCTAFSFAIRLIFELLPVMTDDGEGLLDRGEDSDSDEREENRPPTLKLDKPSTAFFNSLVEFVESNLSQVWDWLTVIMDRTEAQLKYGNAVMSTYGPHLDQHGKSEHKEKKHRRYDSGRKNEKMGDDTMQAGHAKRDTFNHLFAVMRAQTGEAGDELPNIDFDLLKSLSFVADSYLLYTSVMHNVKGKPHDKDAQPDAENISQLRRFFQRSNSVSYPGISYSDAHDTLSNSYSTSLPLVDRPYLLTPSAEREHIFGGPVASRTIRQHRELASLHGQTHAGHQGLAPPCTPIDNLFADEQELSDPADVVMDEIDANKDEHMYAGEKSMEPPEGFEKISMEDLNESFQRNRNDPVQKVVGKWKNTLQLMARDYHSDVLAAMGGEVAGSMILTELAGFGPRQTQFRRRMDRFRALVTKDISLEVHRDPAQLVRDTVYQLNRLNVRRQAHSNARVPGQKEECLRQPALAAHRVKVKFTDEPGEGTGVARSFYTALAESLQSLKSFPFPDYGWNSNNDEYLYGGGLGFVPGQQSDRPPSSRRIQVVRGGREALFARRKSTPRRLPLNLTAQPYSPADIPAAEALSDQLQDAEVEPTGTGPLEGVVHRLPPGFADRLWIKVRAIQPSAASRITGILMDLPSPNAAHLVSNNDLLRGYVADAIELLMTSGHAQDVNLLANKEERDDPDPNPPCDEPDDSPLFFKPSKRAFYSPVPGRLSPMRLSAFRNVGRVIGLCISQCEMFPMRISRHVLKFIVDRPISWHDLAFFDPTLFESLRQLILEGHGQNHETFFDTMQLNFTCEVPPEAAGVPGVVVELKKDGANIPVTKDNIIEYVYRFVDARLLGHNLKCLQAIRNGVLDVVPAPMLSNLTAEDLRLILCGTETVSMTLMQSYTTFSDESHSSPDTIARFKQWFWSVADKFTNQEKQDLIFFWTGSPSIPSSEEAFQPMPTVMIRPPDDCFLPTANTCISRLYLPLYTSKKVLQQKLQMAIKSKNFGFV